MLTIVSDTVNTIRETTAHTHARLERRGDVEILDWLTPVDFGSQQSDYIGKRQPGTGDWLLESEKFLTWLNTTNSTLFCPGIPGAGKTILTSVVVDFLLSKFANKQGIGIAYIYCNFRQQYDLGDLLTSVLKQLTQCRSCLPDCVKSLYDHHKTRRTRPSIDEILESLQSVVPAYSRTFIIVDALDECQSADMCRYRFLKELFSLQTRYGINIFATSRFIPEIEKSFETSLSMEIRASQNDITTYLNSHLDRLPPFVRTNELLQHEIMEVIAEVVDGMYVFIVSRRYSLNLLKVNRFLLAQLYLDVLADTTTANEIRSAVRAFQKQGQAGDQKDQVLERVYEQAMLRISGQNPAWKELAFKVLLWITFAKRQLTTLELQHALATKIGTSELDHDDLPDLEIMVSACAGLVTVDEESGIIRLVHSTTQAYLSRTSTRWFPDHESIITTTCATYLLFTNFGTGYCPTDKGFEERLRSNPFYDYAACNWGHHAIHEALPNQVVMNFLRSENSVQACFQALYLGQRHLKYTYQSYSQDFPKEATWLHLARHFELDTVTHALLASEHSSHMRNNYDSTP